MLCAFIIHERHKGKSSFWAPYIQCLPKAFSTPSFFTSEEHQRLPESLTKRVREQRQLVSDGFDKLSKFFKCSQKSNSLGVFPFTMKDFMWAWFAVNTRTLYKTREDCCGEDLVDPMEKDVYVLAPFMDLLNHSPSAKVGFALPNCHFLNIWYMCVCVCACIMYMFHCMIARKCP